MTRFLSSALGAVEPAFSQSIQQLEHAAGRPGTDIRLTTELAARARAKVAELGLDPKDTTGQELYEALKGRLATDEGRVRSALGIAPNTGANDILMRVQQFVSKHDSLNCFALKSSVAKRLLKKKPPKVVMKRLGYRSIDSMLKHEPVAQLYAAALIAEPASWHRDYHEQYVRLGPGDFEQRALSILYPRTKRWQDLAATFENTLRHNMISFKELGAIVMLPLSTAPAGLATTTLLLMLEEMNSIRAQSSFMKLQQVKPDFGRVIQRLSKSEAYTSAELAGQAVPWRMIQRFYARTPQAYHSDIFEPHVQLEDLQWRSGEDVLAELEPTLAFWQDTQCLGFLQDGQPVSCNVLDVALSYCNQLSYTDRIVHFLRDNLWHELMLRYLDQQNLEEAVHRQLSAELAEPLAFAEQET